MRLLRFLDFFLLLFSRTVCVCARVRLGGSPRFTTATYPVDEHLSGTNNPHDGREREPLSASRNRPASRRRRRLRERATDDVKRTTRVHARPHGTHARTHALTHTHARARAQDATGHRRGYRRTRAHWLLGISRRTLLIRYTRVLSRDREREEGERRDTWGGEGGR